LVVDASMLDIQAALFALTGKPATGVFQTLSAGNMGQAGAPGTGVPADAVVDEMPTVRPSPITPAVMNATSPAMLCRRTSAPSLPQRRYPTRGVAAVKGQRTDKRR
jgi:hypothetical protein